MIGLHELLDRRVGLAESGRDGFFDFDSGFCTPGFWTAYVARARSRGLRTADLRLPSQKLLSYAYAIGIEHALGEKDSYLYERPGAGKAYSPLVLLESIEQTERATGEINSCVRALFSDGQYAAFVSNVCELVGDLLDNVWSHGKSAGLSMAQRWTKGKAGEFFFELAIADHGYGFLRELKRAGIPGIESHAAAIKWSIQRGHSTKMKAIDEWAQRLPSDVMGNPIPGVGRVVESDNHHMGLGLAKLIDTVRRFYGRLWLASGDAMLNIESDGSRDYETIEIPWQGVAIACRFHSDRVRRAIEDGSKDEFVTVFEQLVRE